MTSILIFISTMAIAAAPVKPRKISNTEPVELGQCQPKEDSANKLTEEHFARAEAKHFILTNEEILARLIFSESLSTGYWKRKCQASSPSAIMTAIGWGVMNRVDKKIKSPDAYYDIIFQKSQFRTSFSGKKKNPFAVAFLCPQKSQDYFKDVVIKASAAEVYLGAQLTAKNIIQTYNKSGIPDQYKGITNFFYPFSEFFGEMRPSWAKDSNPEKNKGYINLLGVPSEPCVEAYLFRRFDERFFFLFTTTTAFMFVRTIF